jgi:hypothetical protein
MIPKTNIQKRFNKTLDLGNLEKKAEGFYIYSIIMDDY